MSASHGYVFSAFFYSQRVYGSLVQIDFFGQDD